MTKWALASACSGGQRFVLIVDGVRTAATRRLFSMKNSMTSSATYQVVWRARNKKRVQKYNARYALSKAAWYRKNKKRLDAKRTDPKFKKRKKSYMVEWRARNRKHRKTYQVAWVKKNKKQVRKYKAARYSNDPQYRIRTMLRSRLRTAMIRYCGSKCVSAVRDLGCSIPAFQVYIEKQFWSGMTWGNWSQAGWNLDHKIPLASFDLTDRR